MSTGIQKHYSIVEYLHESVKNPNIHIRGKNSYYSNAWTETFEKSVVRYLYGDEYSSQAWEPLWDTDQLYIGNYVCIGAEIVILMGANHTHRSDWFSLYPFTQVIPDAYKSKGDTVIDDGAWIGMRAMLMPGIHIGEGAIIASGAIVTKDVAPYSIVAGNPATQIRLRFPQETISKLLQLKIYEWDEEKFNSLRPFLCTDNLDSLLQAEATYTNKN